MDYDIGIVRRRRIISPDDCYFAVPAGSTPLDPATTAWVNAVVADFGAVSPTQQSRVNALITSLKSAGLFTATGDRMWLYGQESDAHQAKIDIISLASHTLTGAPALSAGGYTGDGSTAFIDTGFNPSTAGGHFSQNSAAFGVYVQTSRTTGQNYAEIGAVNSGSKECRLAPVFGGGPVSIVEINQTVQDQPTPTNASGLWIVSRTGAGATACYRNGTLFSPGTQTSSLVPTLNFYVLGENFDGALNLPSADKISASFIFGGLDATQAANLSTALNAYHTSWGINTYP